MIAEGRASRTIGEDVLAIRGENICNRTVYKPTKTTAKVGMIGRSDPESEGSRGDNGLQ